MISFTYCGVRRLPAFAGIVLVETTHGCVVGFWARSPDTGVQTQHIAPHARGCIEIYRLHVVSTVFSVGHNVNASCQLLHIFDEDKE